MSLEGNKVFNDDPGGFPIYDLSSLPKGYEAPPGDAVAHKQQIMTLLGFGP